MAPNVKPFLCSTLLGSCWTLHYCIARHGLNIHHRKIHHWSRSLLQSPVRSAFSLPKWRRRFFWGFFFFVPHCKQPHPEQSSRVLTHLMWLASTEDMLSQRSRCEDSSCRRRHTDLSCLKSSPSFRLQTTLGGPAVGRDLPPSHSGGGSSLPALIISLLKGSESVKHWKQESCKCTLTSCQTLK